MKENINNEKSFVEADDMQPKPSSSFNLKKTSKGVNIDVKIYACDTTEDIDRAMVECEKRFQVLFDKYGRDE
jgi:hypothetical protein